MGREGERIFWLPDRFHEGFFFEEHETQRANPVTTFKYFMTKELVKDRVLMLVFQFRHDILHHGHTKGKEQNPVSWKMSMRWLD